MRVLKLLALAAATSQALPLIGDIGIGGHWAPNQSAKIAGLDNQSIYSYTAGSSNVNASLTREAVSGLGGFGLKVWWKDIMTTGLAVEATGNFQASGYDAALRLQGTAGPKTLDTTYVLAADLGFPGLPKATPGFGLGSADLTASYRVFETPKLLVLPTLGLYVGGGMSYGYQTRVLDSAFTRSVVETTLKGIVDDPNSLEANPNLASVMAASIGKQLAKEGFEKSVGGHAMIGLKLSLPVIPIAAYANYKRYFNVSKEPLTSADNVLELGGGFEF